MKNFRNDFPLTAQYTYLNTAGTGLMGEPLMDWRQEHDLDYLIGGSMYREKQHSFINEVRKTVGVFVNAPASNIALVPNFTIGWNMVLDGLSSDDSFLMISGDYPSILWPVEKRGFQCSYIEMTSEMEDQIAISFQNNKPSVFVFSIVQYSNGLKINLDFIKKLKAKNPNVLFVADGTQFIGTAPFDFSDAGIDIVISSAYKWLLGGYGCAFMAFSEFSKSKLIPKTIGFNSNKYNPDTSLLPFTGYFEPGHHDMFAVGGMAFSMKYLMRIGLDKIYEYVYSISKRAFEVLLEMDLLDDSIIERGIPSHILRIKGDQKLFEYLKGKNIVVTHRSNAIRVSVHFYNTEKEINQLLDALRKYFK